MKTMQNHKIDHKTESVHVFCFLIMLNDFYDFDDFFFLFNALVQRNKALGSRLEALESLT